jgi:hypothetical protein
MGVSSSAKVSLLYLASKQRGLILNKGKASMILFPVSGLVIPVFFSSHFTKLSNV